MSADRTGASAAPIGGERVARSPKLKVYCTPVGFYDAVVAAPSQKAALKAWGTSTDLFAAGRASVVDDAALQAEALARPGEVVRKMRGDPVALLGEKPGKSSRPVRARSSPAKSKPEPPPRPLPPPDRSSLETAEAALAAAEGALAEELERIAASRLDLDRQEAALRSDADKRLGSLRRAKGEAQAAYEAAMAVWRKGRPLRPV